MREKGTIVRAMQYCQSNKHRFTPPRERVLKLLIETKQPIGAYQILEKLSSDQLKMNPPTVYRAIHFWEKHGFIHKIQSMNTYILCCEHHQHHNLFVFVCTHCQAVTELEASSLPKSISHTLQKKHFMVVASSTEIYGLCANCRLTYDSNNSFITPNDA